MTISKARLEAEEKRRGAAESVNVGERILQSRKLHQAGMLKPTQSRAELEKIAKGKTLDARIARADLRVGWYT